MFSGRGSDVRICKEEGHCIRTDIFLLEFPSQVTLDEGGFAHATISNKDKLTVGSVRRAGQKKREERP